MYTSTNYQSKAALKKALASGIQVAVFSPGPFPCPQDGKIALEGPHYPQPHKWYASAVVKDGIVVKVS